MRRNINLSINPVMEEKTDENGKKVQVERLPGLDNHTMGTIFEELLRKFNEENNVTEAGEHFTPRDYVRLLADLAVVPIKDKLTDNTYHIYDGACGTGGILTIAQEEMERIAKEQGKDIKVSIFGQELQPDTYATCKADLMISGNINKFTYRLDSGEHQYIAFGSTISQDGHAGEKYDFCISNPPFGTPWKEDLKNWGLGDKKEVIDPRFFDGSISFLPAIGDCQMLFLANNLSRMKDTPLGTRIVEVHDGSSLYGKPTDGDSNLRKYVLENDLLEAIIAAPEDEFYNTPLGTYIWVLTNRKEQRKQGKIQLINARTIATPLRQKLGKKRNMLTSEAINKVLQLVADFTDNEHSRIVTKEDLGYWEIQLYEEVRDNKGKRKLQKLRNEKEIVPLTYPGGLEAFKNKELSELGCNITYGDVKVFYEISFTKYFYHPISPRTDEDVLSSYDSIKTSLTRLAKQIPNLQKEISDLEQKIPYDKYKECEIQWIGNIPDGWTIEKVRKHFLQRNTKVSEETYAPLSVTKDGIVPQLDSVALSNAEGNSRKAVEVNDFVVNSRSDRKGSCGVSSLQGSVSLINIVLEPHEILPEYAHYLFRTKGWVEEFFKNGQGIAWDLWTTNFQKMKNMLLPVPPIDEQLKIVQKIQEIEKLYGRMNLLLHQIEDVKQQIISDLAVGRIKAY